MARSFKRPDEAAMQRVFARTSGGAAEVVLRLAWLQGLHRAEITALRWDQVDFARNLLRLPGGEVSMGSRLRRMLSETLARRKDPAEERVFTSPATGRPMERAQLTAAARTALLRGGLEGVSLRELCAEGRRADHSRMLAAQGWLERGDVMRLLGVSRTAARAAAPAAAGSGGTGARGRAVLPCGRGDAAGGAAGCDPNVSAGTRQRPPSGFSQAAECFPGTGDADPAAADGAGGADSHGAALHAAKREIAGYDCRNY